MGAELTVRVERPYPTEDSAMAATAGGSFTADTYSFILVAWYVSGQNDNDNAGWIKTIPAEWENLVVALNDYVTIDWEVPQDANGENVYPHHYTVYCQAASSYTLGSAGTACTTAASPSAVYTIAGTATSATLYSEGTVEKTFAATATSIVLNPILDMKPEVRQQTVRCFDGRLAKKSYAHLNPVNALDFVIVGGSTSNVSYKKILKWILYSVPCRIAESTTAVAEDDPLVTYWYGRWVDSPDYLGSKQKNTSTSFRLRFEVETGGLA